MKGRAAKAHLTVMLRPSDQAAGGVSNAVRDDRQPGYGSLTCNGPNPQKLKSIPGKRNGCFSYCVKSLLLSTDLRAPTKPTDDSSDLRPVTVLDEVRRNIF